MFVRVKTTPNSPRKSVQIVGSVRKGAKVTQKILRHVGIAMNDSELEGLKILAESIKKQMEIEEKLPLFSPEQVENLIQKKPKEITEEDYKVDVRNLEEEDRVITGIHEAYGPLFNELGYNKLIKNKSASEIFKNIVLARIANPQSKKASVEMLEEDFGINIDLHKVYRMMDKLDDKAIARLNGITYQNTIDLFGQKLDVIFFDCTTLYFESFVEDELKRYGYSKDMKFNQSQILLALMVTKDGLPVGYEIFAGDTYEGHTLIPQLKKLKEKYKIDEVIFVADAGMLNKDNIEELDKINGLTELEAHSFKYILGARIKNTSKAIQDKILDLSQYKGSNTGIKLLRLDYGNGKELVVSYSMERATKDASDRKKSIEKLKKKLEKQKNPKDFLSNYGYKKYLKLKGKSSLILDEVKIDEDSKWDGLHGIVTNATKITDEQIIEQYSGLWQVEESFRITKHDLEIRPVYHWTPERVKAHVAICFTSFALVRYMEYRVKLQYIKLSPEKIRNALLHVAHSIMFDKTKNIRYAFPSKISLEAKKIFQVLGIKKTITPYILEKM